ncbi:hypothetical protein TSUD_63680 [Trifolium subterraneum]|uniref:TF-B3 domain-containing protein n=1 Tax=Trifolium subterraneum TaxID=3900 RepID=A0A2Z6NIV5_TRISU|nr:hypothetical protein TSUD_63680 [Trifolium subterraneum]
MASFTAIYLSNQIFGEFDPYFIKEYGAELLESWIFIDYKDKMHSVTFNMSSIRPLLTYGWREMKDVFGFGINQEVDFLYYGKSVFGFMCSKPLDCYCQIPIYHSRFTRFSYTVEFFLGLTTDNVSKPFLNVFDAFEEFLRSSNFEFILLCCDNGCIDAIDIALTDKPFITTSVGIGWNNFCVRGEFVAGDFLCFKFTVLNGSNVTCVYKLN